MSSPVGLRRPSLSFFSRATLPFAKPSLLLEDFFLLFLFSKRTYEFFPREVIFFDQEKGRLKTCEASYSKLPWDEEAK